MLFPYFLGQIKSKSLILTKILLVLLFIILVHLCSQCKVEGSYEFNKLLENYKGEKKTEESETTLNNETPVKIPPGHTTEAK